MWLPTLPPTYGSAIQYYYMKIVGINYSGRQASNLVHDGGNGFGLSAFFIYL